MGFLRRTSRYAALNGRPLSPVIAAAATAVGSTANHGPHRLQHRLQCSTWRIPAPLPAIWQTETWQRCGVHRRFQSHPSFQPQHAHPCCRSYPRLSHITEWGAPRMELTPRSRVVDVTQCSSRSLQLVVHGAPSARQSRFLFAIEHHRARLRRELPLLHASWSLMHRSRDTSCCKY
jgi:hypothetical protein